MTDGMLKEIETVVRQVMDDYGIVNIDRMITVNHAGSIIKVDAQHYNHHRDQVFPSFDLSVWLGQRDAVHPDRSMKRTMIIFNGHISPMTLTMIERIAELVDETWHDLTPSWI